MEKTITRKNVGYFGCLYLPASRYKCAVCHAACGRSPSFPLPVSSSCRSNSPIPLATFVGEPTQNIGKSFLKSFAGVCMEGVVILLACAVYTAYGSSSFISTAENNITDAAIVWMELLCGPDGVYVCPGGGDQDGRPGSEGDDGAVKRQYSLL